MICAFSFGLTSESSNFCCICALVKEILFDDFNKSLSGGVSLLDSVDLLIISSVVDERGGGNSFLELDIAKFSDGFSLISMTSFVIGLVAD